MQALTCTREKNMLSIVLGSIETTVQAKFDELWWACCRGMMNIIDLLEKVFKFVVGADTSTFIDANGETSGANDLLTNIFVDLFGKEGSMKNVYWSMIVLCMILMTVFTIIGVIKAQFTKEPMESIKKMTGKAFC